VLGTRGGKWDKYENCTDSWQHSAIANVLCREGAEAEQARQSSYHYLVFLHPFSPLALEVVVVVEGGHETTNRRIERRDNPHL
jgi:hypothetical protein